ncbi:MAG: 2OG-Fe(II) oxygenase [Acidobacteria bacterium]|nr:2OG-Fe(II) oxygenase [Acidobacteriota bacterium]
MSRFTSAASELAEQGWTIINDFLSSQAVFALFNEAQQLWDTGHYKNAGIGRGSEYTVREDVRNDHIFWLNEQTPTDAQVRYWEVIEQLQLELNRELFLSLDSFEAHYAVYPPGAFYLKHTDRFTDSDERLISSTLYLNPDWDIKYGGQLRLYTAEECVDVLPMAGTCVLFRSDIFFHEVRPATQLRFSLTGWFRRRSLRVI